MGGPQNKNDVNKNKTKLYINQFKTGCNTLKIDFKGYHPFMKTYVFLW